MTQAPRSVSPTHTRLQQAEVEAIAQDLEAEGAHQGVHHRDGSPADREHGRKTRAHNKDIISGRA